MKVLTLPVAKAPSALWPAAYLTFIWFAFIWAYPMKSNTFFWMCLLCSPLALTARGGIQLPYTILGAVALAFHWTYPTTTGMYLLTLLVSLAIIQFYIGRTPYPLLVLAFLSCPLLAYFTSMASFPARMLLANAATTLLGIASMEVTASGNEVSYGGHTFLVDQACAGIYMLEYGLLMGTVMLALFGRRHRLGLVKTALAYVLLVASICLCNIVRITLLIVFAIMPSHWLHEGLGLILFVLLVLFPFYHFTHKLFVRPSYHKKPRPAKTLPHYAYVIMCTTLIVSGTHHLIGTSGHTTFSAPSLPGYVLEVLDGDIVKYESSQALIYIKPPVAGYRSDHHPTICWRGSGYTFKKINQQVINSTHVKLAELSKNGETLHTVWWYESKALQTGDQWIWRKRSLLHDEAFHLINITCRTQEHAYKTASSLLDYRLITRQRVMATPLAHSNGKDDHYCLNTHTQKHHASKNDTSCLGRG